MKRASRFRTTLRRWGVKALDVVKHLTLKDSELYATGNSDVPGVPLTPYTIMQLDTVWSCVRLIAETLSTLPLGIYSKKPGGSKDYAEDHPLHFILHDQPNIDSTAAVFWEAMISAMLLRGAGRAEKLMVGNEVVGLSFLDPARLQIRTQPNGTREYNYPRPDGSMRPIPSARIFTIPGFSLNGIDGVSVVQYGAKVFGSAMAAENAAARTFKNGMLPTVYYKIASWLKPAQRTEFKDNVMGTVERGEAPLLEGGIDVGTIGIKPEDAQLLQTRGYGVEMICRWFRVPPWMVGHTEKSTSWGTGIEQQMIGFLIFTLSPWIRRIEQAIGKDLITSEQRTRFYAKFSVEGLLRADSAARATFYGLMVDKGIFTRDFCRELEDQPTLGGNAGKLTVQSQMVLLDDLGKEAAAPVDDANAARDALMTWLGREVAALKTIPSEINATFNYPPPQKSTRSVVVKRDPQTGLMTEFTERE